ncbi:family 20 glycosylhydrolase [candidate division KSB1 bacterium]|nr:family 20 glycosylhydrolase [candidate division KSB1 bacterium]
MNHVIMMITIAFLLFFILGCISKHRLTTHPDITIIPKPMELKQDSGVFVINAQTALCVADDNEESITIAKYVAHRFKTAAGWDLKISNKIPDDTSRNAICFSLEKDSQPGGEGYRLTVTPDRITAIAAEPAGLFYSVQTLFQLLPAEIYCDQPYHGDGKWSLPCVRIVDKPRFGWRGMHLDVCRHFYPKEFVKRYIDFLAMHKMNVFHWHLTEDQGWRIEIEKYPKLTEVGAWRADRPGKSWDECEPQKEGEPATYGGYFSKEDVREIVQYAKERYITVVPEIEMPGHALAAMASYPEYSCTGGPFKVATGGYWPIVDVFCPGKDETFKFLEDVLSEVIELFPGEYIHIGGDEVNKANWEKCPHCQARMKAEGLKTAEELQSYFIKRIEKFLISKSKKLIGWDEILEGGLAPEATVMSWRGTEGGIAAAQQNHDVVMSPTSHCYFDFYQDDPEDAPEAIGGYTPLEKVYEFEPTPPELTEMQARHILGAQANVWTEYMPNEQHVEYMALPRMCALAEVVWSAKDSRNIEDFLKRMAYHYVRLIALKANYRQPDLLGTHRQNAFIDTVEVQIHSQRLFTEIHYTLDGSEPTTDSPRYAGPIRITSNTELRACEFYPDGKAGKVKQAFYEKQIPLNPVQIVNPQKGIRYAYFALPGEIKTVERLKDLNPDKTGISPRLTFPFDDLPEYFGLIFEGYIYIDETDIYRFTAASNDGSRLYIGSKLLIDNDGLHGQWDVTAQIVLGAGFHPIRVEYFQGGANKHLKIYYENFNTGKNEIPESALFHKTD